MDIGRLERFLSWEHVVKMGQEFVYYDDNGTLVILRIKPVQEQKCVVDLRCLRNLDLISSCLMYLDDFPKMLETTESNAVLQTIRAFYLINRRCC